MCWFHILPIEHEQLKLKVLYVDNRHECMGVGEKVSYVSDVYAKQ